MNIQIYALKRNFDVQKAERYFKERRIKYQYIDIGKRPISPRELDAVCAAVGLDDVIDTGSRLYAGSVLRYTGDAARKKDLLMADMRLLRTPIVRNGRMATVGYRPDVWDGWE